eukprot:49304_1
MLQIFVNSHSFNGTIVVNIDENKSIKDVKLTIEDQHGIPATQQRLTHFSGTVLKDNFSLAHYQLQNETLLLHIKVPPQNAKSVQTSAHATEMRSVIIAVEQINGNITRMLANETDQIQTLKTEIERIHGIPIDHQCLLLNDIELNDESTVIQNLITPQTTLKLKLSSYHKYKLIQESTTKNMNPESAKASAILDLCVTNLNFILSASRNRIAKAPNFFELSSMAPNVFERIASQVNTIDAHSDTLRQRTNEAKRIINDNHEKVVSVFMQERRKFVETIHHLDDEINTLDRQIEVLQRTKQAKERAKQAKHSFLEAHYNVYAKAYQSIRQDNCTELDRKLANVESICAAVHGMEYDTQVKEMLDAKFAFFERKYVHFQLKDTIEWIKTIENGHFDDKKFEPFILTITDLSINGQMLSEINNNLFLKTTGGLKEERDRHILRKHINRIVTSANDAPCHNMCVVCTENTINTVNLPCGHCCTCSACAEQARQQITKCQICRKEVWQIVQTFMNGFSK